MGYDLYGINPQSNTEEPEIIQQFSDDKGWAKWDEMTEDDKERYFKAKDEHQTENPGEYFRANVWYWRPIWNFVCEACDDFMTSNDMDAGCSNSGDRISKTKALRMARRLDKLEKDGFIARWEEVMLEPYEKAQAHNKIVRQEMKEFQDKMKEKYGDIAPKDYPKKEYKKWEKIYAKEDWTASYPPSRKAILEFSRFCRQSGGFEIC
jgi:hypothetical protein